jgi:hypothetical protein
MIIFAYFSGRSKDTSVLLYVVFGILSSLCGMGCYFIFNMDILFLYGSGAYFTLSFMATTLKFLLSKGIKGYFTLANTI